jgi:hypothetical protein
MVDADTPATYRLPNVSSFAPTPVDAAASPPPQAVLPPVPPIGNPVAPQNRIAVASAPEASPPRGPNTQGPAGEWPALTAEEPFAEPVIAAEPTPSPMFEVPRVENPTVNPDPERSVMIDAPDASAQSAPQFEADIELPQGPLHRGPQRLS